MLISGASIMASIGASALAKVNALTAPKATDTTSGGGVTAADKSAKDEFLDYAKMTPAEKMRAAMLGKLGVTEEQLKAMSPEERKKVEDKIKDMIKQQVQNDPKMQKGSILDVTA
jgi:hypothetical protein